MGDAALALDLDTLNFLDAGDLLQQVVVVILAITERLLAEYRLTGRPALLDVMTRLARAGLFFSLIAIVRVATRRFFLARTANAIATSLFGNLQMQY